MSAYMRSTIKEDVDREIGILLDIEYEMDESHCEPLKDIIKNHRLRAYLAPDFAGLIMKT